MGIALRELQHCNNCNSEADVLHPRAILYSNVLHHILLAHK